MPEAVFSVSEASSVAALATSGLLRSGRVLLRVRRTGSRFALRAACLAGLSRTARAGSLGHTRAGGRSAGFGGTRLRSISHCGIHLLVRIV